MQKDRLHPVVSQPALVSVDLASIGHRWYLTTSVALSKIFAHTAAAFAHQRWELLFCECVAEGELKAWQTKVRTQHRTEIASGGNLVCNV